MCVELYCNMHWPVKIFKMATAFSTFWATNLTCHVLAPLCHKTWWETGRKSEAGISKTHRVSLPPDFACDLTEKFLLGKILRYGEIYNPRWMAPHIARIFCGGSEVFIFSKALCDRWCKKWNLLVMFQYHAINILRFISTEIVAAHPFLYLLSQKTHMCF